MSLSEAQTQMELIEFQKLAILNKQNHLNWKTNMKKTKIGTD